MRFRDRVALCAASGAVAIGAQACSVDSPPALQAQNGTCATYTPPSTFNAVSPTVSFTNDVLPLINRSCAFTSCHGSLGNPTGGLYLGQETSRMYLGLVGVPSTIDPSVARVQAGDPANSFLQRKIDGDACTLASCSGTCAASMPEGQDLMAVSDRLLFRAWIAQGAVADFPVDGADAGHADGSGE